MSRHVLDQNVGRYVVRLGILSEMWACINLNGMGNEEDTSRLSNLESKNKGENNVCAAFQDYLA